MSLPTWKSSPDQDVYGYLAELRAIPVLSIEEEEELFRRWRDKKDPKASERIVVSHMRLVANVAARHRGYGLPLGDLISEGSIGVMRALDRFDPGRGFRFATYALWWVRAVIQDYVLRNWSLLRIGKTAAQKKLFFSLRRTKSFLEIYDDGDLTPEQLARIASMLNVPEREVVSMNRRLAAPDFHLDAPLTVDGKGMTWLDTLVDESVGPEEVLCERMEFSQRMKRLVIALEVLSPREREVLAVRYMSDSQTTMRVVAGHLGVSVQRIQQIEKRALEKLRKAMKRDRMRPPQRGENVLLPGQQS